VNKKGLPVWKLAYSFSVYIILPEISHQYFFAAVDISPWSIFHSRKKSMFKKKKRRGVTSIKKRKKRKKKKKGVT
jgi:hypothetical protein